MSQPDEQLRELFRDARQSERDNAPRFGATWAAARETARPSRHLAWGLAIAAAAAVVVGLIAWPRGPALPPNQPPEFAETKPVPDVPVDDESSELAELADSDWGAEGTLGVPTDFLLESDGALAGGIPSTELDDPAFGLEGGFETEL